MLRRGAFLVTCGLLACADTPPRNCTLNGQPQKLIAAGEHGVIAMAADADHFFWVAGTQVRSASACGGAAITLAEVGGASAMALTSGHVVVADTSLGQIVRIPKAGGDGQVLANNAPSRSLATDERHVYWLESPSMWGAGSLRRTALEDGTVETLVTGLHAPVGLSVAGRDVVWGSAGMGVVSGPGGSTVEGGGLWRLPQGSGVPIALHSSGIVQAVFARERTVTWFGEYPNGVALVDLDGSQGARSIRQLPPNSAAGCVDDDAVYWVEGANAVVRLPRSGGDTTVLVSGLPGVTTLAAYDRGVLAATGDGRILWVAGDGSANVAETVNGECPTPVGSQEEVDQTPRADAYVELIALALEPERATASQATYDRVARDLDAIGTQYAFTRGIRDLRGLNDGRRIGLRTTVPTARSMKAGFYRPWECLNAFYRLASADISNDPSSPVVSLRFRGMLNTSLVAGLYARLPGVENAYAGGGAMDGPRLCVHKEATLHHYVFQERSGDCPAGCALDRATYVTTEIDGTVALAGQWSPDAGGSEPAWVRPWCAGPW